MSFVPAADLTLFDSMEESYQNARRELSVLRLLINTRCRGRSRYNFTCVYCGGRPAKGQPSTCLQCRDLPALDPLYLAEVRW